MGLRRGLRRVTVTHGDVLEAGGHQRFKEAFAFL